MQLRALRILFAVAVVFCAPMSGVAGIIDVWVHQTYDVPENVKLNVRNTDGRIFIYASTEPKLEVKALKRAFSQERVDAIEVKVDVNGDSVTIDTIYPPEPEDTLLADRSGTVDYLLVVPQFATINEARLENGEVMVEGVRGAGVNAHVGTGKLILRQCFSPLQATVDKGSIDLFFGWWEQSIPFTVNAEVTDGDVRLGLPAAAVTRVDAAATGHIANHFNSELDEARDKDSKEWAVAIGEGAQEAPTEMKLRTASGNIRIFRSY